MNIQKIMFSLLFVSIVVVADVPQQESSNRLDSAEGMKRQFLKICGKNNNQMHCEEYAKLLGKFFTKAEQKTGEVGRPLTSDEASELMGEFGHPNEIAIEDVKAISELIGDKEFLSFGLLVIAAAVGDQPELVKLLEEAAENYRPCFDCYLLQPLFDEEETKLLGRALHRLSGCDTVLARTEKLKEAISEIDRLHLQKYAEKLQEDNTEA